MKKIIFVVMLLATVAQGILSCRKEESTADIPGAQSPEMVQAKIAGIVLDESQHPIQGVSVVAYGIIVTTDQNGTFILDGAIAKNRSIVQLSKPGYMIRLHAFKPTPNAINYIHIVLATEPVVQTISATAGGTVSAGSGSSVQFQPNSFVLANGNTLYSGTVSVSAKPILVSDPNFGSMIPGGDLSGKDIAGKNVSLYSFGMMSVVLKGSGGELLQLAPGLNATITIPIAGSQLATASATIPLWYFDETTALWKEEGQATKMGNNYVGTVAHFSTWNCDHAETRATINGRVVDCVGNPMANIAVTINGVLVLWTDQNGNYSRYVPAGYALTFQVLPQGFLLWPSQVENIAPLTAGQTVTVPDLIIPCAAFVTGQLTGCTTTPEEGMVCLILNGQIISWAYTQGGYFSLPAPANLNLTLTALSASGYNSMAVTTPAVGGTVNVGIIYNCNGNSSLFGFTINGGSFSNVAVNAFMSNTGAYYYLDSTGTGYTYCQSNYNSNIGSDSWSIRFPGQQTGSTDLSVASNSYYFNLGISNRMYHPSRVPGDHFMLNITYYGAVGDSIKGTFAGKIVASNDPVGYIISNGHFAVVRGVDR